jgi:type VI secretion system protein VasG
MELELNHELNLKFSPALLGRMNVVPYKTLDEKVLKKIAVDKFSQIAGRLEKNFNIDVTLNDELVEILTQEALQNEQGGARSLIQLIETYILPRITDFVLDIISSDDTPDGIIVSYKDGDVRVEATTLP